jgi:prolyl-tRNA editing enzyme YbaK/EbsC (Cys-tRNA(Pro) deacylase)
VERVRQAATENGIEFELREFGESTRTAKEAAAALGCEVAQIAKSLVFRGEESGDALLVIASGSNRVDEARLQALAGEPIGKADAAFVRECTGFAIGGVPPLGHTRPLRAWVDEDLLRFDRVWAAAGAHNAVFALDPRRLATLCDGEVAAVSQ